MVFVLAFVCLAIFYGLVKFNSGFSMKATYLLLIPSLHLVGLVVFLSLACVLEPVNAGGLWFFRFVRKFVSHIISARSSS